MNTRKNIDYSSLYAGIDKAIATDLPQMELYLELGRLVSSRPEKGAAVMAAEYISANYPNQTGFSPRNLRRMRNFYQMYEGHLEVLEQAMKVGWTQNIVIIEADLNMECRHWYLQATHRLGWTKVELIRQIAINAYLGAIKEEATLNTECEYVSKTLPAQTKRPQGFVDNVVAFLNKIWYNGFWKIYTFRQTGIMGEAYG